MNNILSFWSVFQQVKTDLFRNIKAFTAIAIIQGLVIAFLSLLIMLIVPKLVFFETMKNNSFWKNFFAHQEHAVQFVTVIILYLFKYIIALVTYTGLFGSIYLLKRQGLSLSVTNFFRNTTIQNVTQFFGMFVLIGLMTIFLLIFFSIVPISVALLLLSLSEPIKSTLMFIGFFLALAVSLYGIISEYCLAPYILFENNKPIEKILEESRQRTKTYQFSIAVLLGTFILLFLLFILLTFFFPLRTLLHDLPNINKTAFLVTSYLQQKFGMSLVAIGFMVLSYSINFFFNIIMILTVGEIYKRLSTT